jgi:hypothetical protein
MNHIEGKKQKVKRISDQNPPSHFSSPLEAMAVHTLCFFSAKAIIVCALGSNNLGMKFLRCFFLWNASKYL